MLSLHWLSRMAFTAEDREADFDIGPLIVSRICRPELADIILRGRICFENRFANRPHAIPLQAALPTLFVDCEITLGSSC
jgi:hypothetical protein